jgi:hypothetical protein
MAGCRWWEDNRDYDSDGTREMPNGKHRHQFFLWLYLSTLWLMGATWGVPLLL